jgi:hypothetical protein
MILPPFVMTSFISDIQLLTTEIFCCMPILLIRTASFGGSTTAATTDDHHKMDAVSAAALREENRALREEVLYLREVLGAVQGSGHHVVCGANDHSSTTASSAGMASFNYKLAHVHSSSRFKVEGGQLKPHQQQQVSSPAIAAGSFAASELSVLRRYKAQLVQHQRQIALLNEELQVSTTTCYDSEYYYMLR